MLKDGTLFWWWWLVVVTAVILLLGLSMVLAPGLTRRAFSLLLLASPEGMDAFSDEAVAYITLTQAVLGAIMFGWGVALLFVELGPLREGSYRAWLTLAVSVVAWFVLDTFFSLWSGFWQNAVLNAVLGVLLAIPLAATYDVCRNETDGSSVFHPD